jgi:hypothetical protein
MLMRLLADSVLRIQISYTGKLIDFVLIDRSPRDQKPEIAVVTVWRLME